MIALWTLAFADTPVEEAIQAVRMAEWRRQSPAEILEASTNSEVAVERVRVEALGRSRDPAARAYLLKALTHADAEVQRAAAFGLGLIPNSGRQVASALKSAPSAPGPLAEFDLRWQLIAALGRTGGAAHRTLLVAELDRPWPYDEAAARAILAMHRRGIDVDDAVPPLLGAVEGSDVRTELSIAQALARIGLGDHPTKTAARRSVFAFDSTTRAAWARAALEAGDTEFLSYNLTDTPVVAAAAITYAPNLGPTESKLVDTRSWTVWSALLEKEAGVSPEREGVAARALRAASGRDVSAREGEWPVQAALLGRSVDVEALVKASTASDAHPAVRTAAATRLHELGVQREVLVPLLASPDPGVREAAMTWMEGPPSAELVDEIVLTLRVESRGEVLMAGFDRLLAFRRARRGSVSASRFLVQALKNGNRHRSVPVQRSARALAAALEIELPPAPPNATERELILPSGQVTTTTGDLPKLIEVEAYRSATLHTPHGPVVIELLPETAPMAVYNFAVLARGGFYASSGWHRIVPGFVVQGGCPRGDGWGGPGWMIPDEVSAVPFTEGAVGMARADRDTGGSQFFVATGSARFLDGDYTVFGKVRSGMDALRQLEPYDALGSILIEVDDGS